MRTSLRRRWFATAFLIVVACAVQAAPSSPTRLEGHWVLVEQTYGQGASNLARRGPAIHLDVAVGLDGSNVRVWTGEAETAAVAWPAVVTEETPVPLELLERKIDVDSGRLESRYKVHPPDENQLTLLMVESYDLTPDGKALVGTLTVDMFRHGKPSGSFVLHRRFERESR